VEFVFAGEMIEWRGPAPFYFVRLGEDLSGAIKFAAKGLEYWGQVPVTVTIGETRFTTGLFPKGGVYLLPVKNLVRKAEALEVGMVVEGRLLVGPIR
jgi:hypothetical protein